MSEFDDDRWGETESDWIEDDEEEDMPGDCQALRIAGDALVVRWEWGDEELVPRSVVIDASEVSEPGDSGTLTVKRWWAVKGDRLPAARRRLAAMRRRDPEEPFTAELFIRWRTLAQESTDNPLAPIVLRLLRMVVGMAEERLKANPQH